jgi:hypothetical protein
MKVSRIFYFAFLASLSLA